jgi:hypothetical protein
MVSVYELLVLLEYYCNRNIKVVNVHFVFSVITGTTGMDWEGGRLLGWTGKEGDYWNGLGKRETTGMDWEGVIIVEDKTDRARVKLIYKYDVIVILNVQFVHCGLNAAFCCLF